MSCFTVTRDRILALVLSVMLAYAGVIALRGNVNGKNGILWGLLSVVLFSFVYCMTGPCDKVEMMDGGCEACSVGVEMMKGGGSGEHGDGKGGHGGDDKKSGNGGNGRNGGNGGNSGKKHAPKPADGKQHSTAVPMNLDGKAVKPEHHKKKHHVPASQNGKGKDSPGTGGAGIGAGGKLHDDKEQKALENNKRYEKRGVAMPSQSDLLDVDSSPVTININYSNEVDSQNVEKNSHNRKIEVKDVMREIGNRQIYPGGGELIEPCDGDNCVDNRTYNGYCNKGAYQLAQMQREILNLRRKYNQLAYLNDNPYMPLNQDGMGEGGRRCSVCPLEANGQFASFEGLKKMAEDEPYVNPMMPGVTNRWRGRGGNNPGMDDYSV